MSAFSLLNAKSDPHNFQEEWFNLDHGLGGFSPQSTGSKARTSQWEGCNEIKLLSPEQSNGKTQAPRMSERPNVSLVTTRNTLEHNLNLPDVY